MEATQYYKFLCLLDNASLDAEPVRFGEFEILNFSISELRNLLYRPDDIITTEIGAELDLYSQFPWAVYVRPVPSEQDEVKQILSQFQLAAGHTFEHRSWFPFRDLLATLNLLKESDGPLRPTHFYQILQGNIQSSRQVGRIVQGEPFHDSGEDGVSWPYFSGFQINPKDSTDFGILADKLKLVAEHENKSSHIRVACDFFNLADKSFFDGAHDATADSIPLLILYDAAIEACFILESERGVDNKLKDRIPRLLNSSREGLENFVAELFTLRSKAAHGVWPVSKIQSHMKGEPVPYNNGTIRTRIDKHGRRISPFNTNTRFTNSFLVDVRELARRSIGFALDNLADGKEKKDYC